MHCQATRSPQAIACPQQAQSRERRTSTLRGQTQVLEPVDQIAPRSINRRLHGLRLHQVGHISVGGALDLNTNTLTAVTPTEITTVRGFDWVQFVRFRRK
jgi:hypothetical protein